jgi:hypothetical protein
VAPATVLRKLRRERRFVMSSSFGGTGEKPRA